MKPDDYIVNLCLSDDLLSRCIEDAKSSSFTYYNKQISTYKNKGPQKIKPVNSAILDELENMIGIKCHKAAYLECVPHFITEPHIDINSTTHRKSCLTWAISFTPSEIAPTLFYEGNTVIARHIYDRRGFILDTRICHGMINNSNTRLLLQLMFDMEPFDLRDAIHGIHTL